MKGPASLPTHEVGGGILQTCILNFIWKLTLFGFQYHREYSSGGGCVTKLDGRGGLHHGCGSTD